MIACRICGNARGNPLYQAREMMFGWRDRFDYLECAHCGCVQLVAPPADMGRYYPAQYYSYAPARVKPVEGVAASVRAARSRHHLGESGLVGALIASVSKRPHYVGWLAGCGLALDSRILDVGCGAGGLLLKMRRDGFMNVAGMDPFIERDLVYENGVTVRRGTLDQLSGEYDFIMLHHSFEHMPEPARAMEQLRGHLAPSGYILLRLPVAGGHAWRKYRANWIGLDAPRHVFLHTPRSLALLAARAALCIEREFYDSGSRQFAGSEMMLRDIPLCEGERRTDLFSAAQIEAFEQEAKALNSLRDGDCAGFYLRHAGP